MLQYSRLSFILERCSRARNPGDGCPVSTLRRDISGVKPVQPVANPVEQIELAKKDGGSVLLTDCTARLGVATAAEEANVTHPISHASLCVIIRLENQ